MERFTIILLIIYAVLAGSINGSSESDSSEENKGTAMYQQLYCQTEVVLKEKLIDLPEDTENGFKILAGDNVDQLDCPQLLTKSKQKIYKELRKQQKKSKTGVKTINCSINKLEEHGYEKIRYKMNSLLGLNLTNEKKKELRTKFIMDINDIHDKIFDECTAEGAAEPSIDIRGEFDESNLTVTTKKNKKASSSEED